MARILKPPAPLPVEPGVPQLFLAGSIEMGRAVLWQQQLEQALADLDILILNPRRDEWDASWEQHIGNAPFREQVEWELAAQEQAGLIAMYFAPGTQSPITLLELGLFAHTGKIVVCCPDGFWRKGNVDIVCQRYAIPTVATLDELARALRARLSRAEGPGAP
jgi:hypothetical protein